MTFGTEGHWLRDRSGEKNSKNFNFSTFLVFLALFTVLSDTDAYQQHNSKVRSRLCYIISCNGIFHAG